MYKEILRLVGALIVVVVIVWFWYTLFPSTAYLSFLPVILILKSFGNNISFFKKKDLTFYNTNESQQNQHTILNIDKDEFLLNMYGVKFAKAGFSSYGLIATKGDLIERMSSSTKNNFLQKVKRVNPDIILIEIILPAIDGFEMTRLLKKDKATKNIPIIILTNQSDLADIERAKELGAAGYIVKAYNQPMEVVEKIQDILLGKAKGTFPSTEDIERESSKRSREEFNRMKNQKDSYHGEVNSSQVKSSLMSTKPFEEFNKDNSKK